MADNRLIKYSLIIPHFEDTERIQRLLSSLPLNRSDLEVIVVDDCSFDQSNIEILIQRWPTIQFLSTTKNAGAGAARNLGLNHARGEYLVFADSDDEFLPDAFSVFDSYIRPEDELVYFLAEAVQEFDGLPSNRAERPNELCLAYLSDQSKESLQRLKLGHVNPIAKVYSRKFICERGLLFEETRVANDVAFNVLGAIKANHIRVVPVAVYRIFRRAKSLTSNSSSNVFLERLAVQIRLASSIKAIGIKERYSATGWMLSAFWYGPKTIYKTWRMCLRSELRIDVGKALQFSRWVSFYKKWITEHAEKNNRQR